MICPFFCTCKIVVLKYQIKQNDFFNGWEDDFYGNYICDVFVSDRFNNGRL